MTKTKITPLYEERMKLKRQNLLPSGETDICPSNSRVDKCPPILEYRYYMI